MNETEPKILILDIETSPIIAYTWGPKWETNIIDFLEQTQIMSYSVKWLGGKQTTKCLRDFPGYKKGKVNDYELVKSIHDLLDEADIVVTQNGIAFDHKIINARFIRHEINPPSPYKMIDTLNESKRYLRLPSYNLDDMSKYFCIGEKLHHEGFDLWKKCIEGDDKAWMLMKKYNAKDVSLTEEIYLKLRPFIKSHPNINCFYRDEVCPKCGSKNCQKRGFSLTSTGKYQRYQCNNCGGWFSGSRVEHIKKIYKNA